MVCRNCPMPSKSQSDQPSSVDSTISYPLFRSCLSHHHTPNLKKCNIKSWYSQFPSHLVCRKNKAISKQKAMVKQHKEETMYKYIPYGLYKQNHTPSLKITRRVFLNMGYTTLIHGHFNGNNEVSQPSIFGVRHCQTNPYTGTQLLS